MKSVNVTVRLDENVKKEFDVFCENVGISVTAAFNMFIRATLRERALPFAITDNPRNAARVSLQDALQEAQENALLNGTSDMSMDDINDIIAESRQKGRVHAQ
jgi:DNA-damage-inducible protein J